MRPPNDDSELLAYLSHELRTGLNAIVGHAQLVRTSDLSAENARSLERMIDAGFHLVGILDEVADIAVDELRPGNRFPIAEVELPTLLNQLVELLGPLAGAQRVRIEVAPVPADAEHALACRQRLTQILLNLLSNAIKYGGEHVRVTAERVGDDIELSVTDSGPGIDDDRIRDLFTPFERLGAETGPVPGSGLGLALSQRVAEGAGARLWFEPDGEPGATFKVALRAA